MTDRRKRITSFPLPFYHGCRKRYKCVKLPSWDTAKGGHEGSFLQWYVLQGREASRKVCVQDRGVRWMRETIWLDEKNKKTAKQVAAVLAEAKATCSDVRAILQAVWDYLGVTVCEDGDA